MQGAGARKEGKAQGPAKKARRNNNNNNNNKETRWDERRWEEFSPYPECSLCKKEAKNSSDKFCKKKPNRKTCVWIQNLSFHRAKTFHTLKAPKLKFLMQKNAFKNHEQKFTPITVQSTASNAGRRGPQGRQGARACKNNKAQQQQQQQNNKETRWDERRWEEFSPYPECSLWKKEAKNSSDKFCKKKPNRKTCVWIQNLSFHRAKTFHTLKAPKLKCLMQKNAFKKHEQNKSLHQ